LARNNLRKLVANASVLELRCTECAVSKEVVFWTEVVSNRRCQYCCGRRRASWLSVSSTSLRSTDAETSYDDDSETTSSTAGSAHRPTTAVVALMSWARGVRRRDSERTDSPVGRLVSPRPSVRRLAGGNKLRWVPRDAAARLPAIYRQRPGALGRAIAPTQRHTIAVRRTRRPDRRRPRTTKTLPSAQR